MSSVVNNDMVILLNVLKKQLRIHGITYSDAATALNLSEVSIKRIFSKHDCSLTRLNSLCELAKTSFLEISELARMESVSQDYFLNNKQEKYFSANPFNFHLFRLLYRGFSIDRLKVKYSLNTKEAFKVLRDLEVLDLIDIYPNDIVKFKINGKIRLNLKGKLFNTLIKKQNENFINRVYAEHERIDCCLQSSEIQLSQNSINQFVQDINNLGKKYRKLSFHEEKSFKDNELKEVRWFMAFMPYESDWEQYR
jgi:hypothetical protein